MDHVVTQSRVDGAPALLSMWPIALATADGRSATAWRPPALVRGSLCREASSPFHVVRQTYSYELLSSYSHSAGRTRRGVPFLTGQKEDRKSRPNRHALTALASPGCSSVFAFGSWTNPHPPTRAPTLPISSTPPSETPHRERPGRRIRRKKEGRRQDTSIHPAFTPPSFIHPSFLPTSPPRTEHAEFVSCHTPVTTNQ